METPTGRREASRGFARRDARRKGTIMASHGGARNRSGPRFDPTSATSDRLGRNLSALPAEGYRGRLPKWPLNAQIDPESGLETPESKLEKTLWKRWWRTPQAVAWKREPWRWIIVAEMCRLEAIVQLDPQASAALIGQLHRFRDQLGLTPAGLKDNGWQIVQQADERPQPAARRAPSSRDRLKVVARED